MANQYKGEVSLKVEDKIYFMRFTTNSLVELEDAMDSGINTIATKLTDPKNLRIRDIRTLVWAALLDRQPLITIDEVGGIITDAGLKPVMESVSRAFELAFDRSREAASDDVDPTQPGENPDQKSLPLNGSGLSS